jgi:uncharacterized protein (TIGR02147 family)
MNEMPSVFASEHYKDFLRDVVKAGPKGVITKLAEAAGCQRSYMSEALRGEIHLTPDHAYGISQFLNLTRKESDYFLNLLHHARAASKTYRDSLAAILETERRDHRRLTKRLKQTEAVVERQEGRYYASWHYAAIHVATAIDGLNTVKSLAARFALADSLVASILQHLTEEGYVKTVQKQYLYNEAAPSRHLSDQSVFSRINHANWRTLALSRPYRPDSEVHYSSVFAINRRDLQRLRQQLVDFIETQRQAIAQSGSEEVACFTCDLFEP